MYLVAAVGVRDVLRVRHELGELLLCLFLRVVGDVAKVRRNVSWQLACSNQLRDLWPPGPVRRQNYQGEWTQWLGGADLVEAAVRVVPFQVWVQGQALPYLAFHQDSLHRPLLRRLRIPKPLGEGVDEYETGHILRVDARIQPDDQAAIGMPDKHVRTRLIGSTQQGMQVRDRVLCRGRLPHRVTAARLLPDRRSGTS
jgi:hypothetical protein